MPLAPEQRDGYFRDGYLLVRGLIDADTLDRIDTRFLALASGEIPAPFPGRHQ